MCPLSFLWQLNFFFLFFKKAVWDTHTLGIERATFVFERATLFLILQRALPVENLGSQREIIFEETSSQDIGQQGLSGLRVVAAPKQLYKVGTM